LSDSRERIWLVEEESLGIEEAAKQAFRLAFLRMLDLTRIAKGRDTQDKFGMTE